MHIQIVSSEQQAAARTSPCERVRVESPGPSFVALRICPPQLGALRLQEGSSPPVVLSMDLHLTSDHHASSPPPPLRQKNGGDGAKLSRRNQQHEDHDGPDLPRSAAEQACYSLCGVSMGARLHSLRMRSVRTSVPAAAAEFHRLSSCSEAGRRQGVSKKADEEKYKQSPSPTSELPPDQSLQEQRRRV